MKTLKNRMYPLVEAVEADFEAVTEAVEAACLNGKDPVRKINASYLD